MRELRSDINSAPRTESKAPRRCRLLWWEQPPQRMPETHLAAPERMRRERLWRSRHRRQFVVPCRFAWPPMFRDVCCLT